MFLSDLKINRKIRNFAPALTATGLAVYEIRARNGFSHILIPLKAQPFSTLLEVATPDTFGFVFLTSKCKNYEEVSVEHCGCSDAFVCFATEG